MPYIPQFDRDVLEAGAQPVDAGTLNYVITKVVNTYLRRKPVSYSRLNEVIGVLECAKLELYRRMAAPYEDAKCGENGDVYV